MLANLNIQIHLKRLGFTKSDEKTYVIEFTHPKTSYPLYVKKTNRFPLVIHSNYEKIATDLRKISGVSTDSLKPFYFNSNMAAFDKKLNKGQKPERYGLHFGFNDMTSLEEFLKTIGV